MGNREWVMRDGSCYIQLLPDYFVLMLWIRQGCFRRADDAQHAQCLLHTIHRLQCRKYCSSLQTIFEHPVWQIADLTPMAHGKAFPEEKVLTVQADPKDESHQVRFLDDAQHMRRFRQARPWLRVVLPPKRS